MRIFTLRCLLPMLPMLLCCGLNTGCSDAPVNSVADNSGAPEDSTKPEMTPDSLAEPVGSPDAASATDDGSPLPLLGPGSPAPPVSIAKWMQGEPVKSFEDGKVYVVEFWATWCGPCLRSMPHIAKLQKQYGDKVAFMGITAEDEATVAPFLEQESPEGGTWSEVLSYRIALDRNRETNRVYMEAAKQNGIPAAFIVGKTGQVEWIGHPATMDSALAEVVDGSWDSAAAKEAFVQEARAAELIDEAMPRLAKSAGQGDFAEAVKVCDELLAELPGNSRITQIRMSLLLQGNMIEEFNRSARKYVDDNFQNPMPLNQIAWMLADGATSPERDLDVALKAGLQASKLTEDKDGSIMDTVARVYFERGNLTEAIAWQEKAVAAAPEMKELSQALEKYEAAAKQNSSDEEKPKPEKKKEQPKVDDKPAANEKANEEKKADPEQKTSPEPTESEADEETAAADEPAPEETEESEGESVESEAKAEDVKK